MKKNLFVFFGGKSAEHDISIITAITAMSFADTSKYNIYPAYLSPDGDIYTGDKLKSVDTFVNFNEEKKECKKMNLCIGQDRAIIHTFPFKKSVKIDYALDCCHGALGEDGSLQGYFELCDIPYTSSGVMSSAVCMDKKIMKQIFASNNIPIVEHICATRDEFSELQTIIEKRVEKIGYPVVVKPANCGSSIGITKCQDVDELKYGLELSFSFDKTAIIEKCIENLMEINCAVMKVGPKYIISNLEQPRTTSDILSFDDKYINAPQKNTTSTLHENNIKLKKSQKELIKALARTSFDACDCDGIVRIDFMIDQDNSTIYVNEINTIPGSLAYYLFKDKMTPSELVDNLVASAVIKNNEKHKNAYHYKSNAILSFLKSAPSKIRTKKY